MTYDFSSLPKSSLTGKPVLHFAHANGMPSKVYQPLFDMLSEQFTVEYIPYLGIADGYPVDQHWRRLTQQIIDNVSQVCAKHKVHQILALGHSLGSLCTLQAIYKRPEQFAAAVLLDPPWIYGKTSLIWHMAKQLDRLPMVNHRFIDKLSPAGISKNRRDLWDSRAQARESFENKSFFAKFDPLCFDGYIEHGLSERADGKITLTIPKSVEVAIFRTNPSWYWLTPNHPPKRPVTLIVGEDSKFAKYKFAQKIKQRLNIPYELHQGGHMFPLEHPESTVEKVLDVFNNQLSV